MELQWKEEPGQVMGALVQRRGGNRSHGPLAMLLVGVQTWWKVCGVLVTLCLGNTKQISSGARARL